MVDELYGLLELPVRIRAGKRGGRVELRFKDQAELERLLDATSPSRRLIDAERWARDGRVAGARSSVPTPSIVGLGAAATGILPGGCAPPPPVTSERTHVPDRKIADASIA